MKNFGGTPALTTWFKLHYLFSGKCVKRSINWKLCWWRYHEILCARLRKTMKDGLHSMYGWNTATRLLQLTRECSSREGREVLWPYERGVCIEFHHFLNFYIAPVFMKNLIQKWYTGVTIMKVTNKMQLYRLIYYSKSALHVSGDVLAHHQEHLSVFTVSGSIHPSSCRLVTWMSWNWAMWFVGRVHAKTPAGSYLGEYYQILWIQSSAPDDGRKHRPKHIELTRNNKLTCIVASCRLLS